MVPHCHLMNVYKDALIRFHYAVDEWWSATPAADHCAILGGRTSSGKKAESRTHPMHWDV